MRKYKSYIPKFRIVKERDLLYKKVKITQSKDCYDYMKPFFSGSLEVFESSFALFLNSAGNTIGYVLISTGGLNATLIDPIIVAHYAVKSLAKTVILAHNHPSGSLRPSQEDITITKRVSKALALFDIILLDHLIITEEGYYSMADQGQI